SFAFMRALVKKLFKNISFINYILLSEVLAASSGIIFALRKADMYAMPITMGLTLTIMGFYFWFTAYDSSKKAGRIIKLGAGALCMALVAGCRPQLLLGSFLAVPLFWNKTFKERELFSKKAWKETAAFILPYVIVAAVVMWYNYVRFGSPFDFGANYNLTTNDMTKRGMNLGRLPFGIFCYFLQLPVTYAKFPFITAANLSNSYMGKTTAETMFGGIFAAQPVLLILLLIKTVKNELKEKGIFAFAVCCMVFSFIIACADTEMAGVLYRYYLDYSYFMLIPAAITVLALIEKFDNNKGLMFGTSLLCGLCMCYNFAVLLVSANLSHEVTNPNFYYSIASALTFWL
ncbi:MAG: hypothetical protein LUH47_01735, partial [Clostridiales bacterium]|nr:hypothetical protein [Clostridiales bacterium]